MVEPLGSLNTRWSMLDGCRGRVAEDSWRWFIDRYRNYICSCIERLIQPRERAALATEEIWSYLFTSSMIESADKNRRFRSYLAGTVRNFALDWLRRNVAGDAQSQFEESTMSGDPARLLEDQEMHLWKKQVVRLALSKLEATNPQQAQVLRWFYGIQESDSGTPSGDGSGDGLGETHSASWIAQAIELKPNAVHQIVFRGRARLRSCIEAELRETVRSKDDLDDEMRLIYEVIEQEHPGMGG